MPKYKVVLSDSVKHTLANVSKKDKKMLLGAISKIAKDPTTGTPWNPKEIKTFPNERYCRFCGSLVTMMMDPADDKIHIECKCDHSWLTKKELINGRINFLKYIKKDPRVDEFKRLNPNKIEFK